MSVSKVNKSILDTIAVKIADGTLKPIINTTAKNQKIVVLSTEVDNQKSVSFELHHGIGQEVFDSRVIDTISIDNIPLRSQKDMDILLNLSIDDEGYFDIRISIEGTNISFGQTYNLNEQATKVNVDSYTTSEGSVDLSTVSPQEVDAIGPIDDDFVLGIDPYISYKKDAVRHEGWIRTKKKFKKGVRVSVFIMYLLIITGGLLLLAFLVYLSIALLPLPPLEA